MNVHAYNFVEGGTTIGRIDACSYLHYPALSLEKRVCGNRAVSFSLFRSLPNTVYFFPLESHKSIPVHQKSKGDTARVGIICNGCFMFFFLQKIYIIGTRLSAESLINSN